MSRNFSINCICKSLKFRGFTLGDAFLCYFSLCHGLCLNRPSLICSFHFTKRCVLILFFFIICCSLSLSFSLLIHLMQIYGRFRPCYTTEIESVCAIGCVGMCFVYKKVKIYCVLTLFLALYKHIRIRCIIFLSSNSFYTIQK